MRALTTFVFWLALLICLAGWGRLAYVLLVRPTPARVMAFVVDGRRRDVADPPHCQDRAIIEGQAAWRVCGYRQLPGRAPDQDGLVRFDFVARRAEMAWPFPSPARGVLQAVARHPGGDLAVLTLDGHLWIARPAGGVTPLGKAPPRVTGLAWVDDRLEVVDYRGAVTAYEAGQEPVPGGRLPGPKEEPAWLDMLAVAEATDAGWRSIWVRVPVRPGDERPIQAQLLCGGPGDDQAPVDCGRIPLSEGHYVLGQGQLTLVATPLLTTGGNLLPERTNIPIFERGEHGWWPIPAPPGVEAPGPEQFDVRIGPGGLEAIPRFADRGTRWTRTGTDWIGVQTSALGPRLRRASGSVGEPVAASRWLGADSHLVPADGTGFWMLGAFGTFARIGPQLERIDGLGPVERVTRLYADFERLGPFSDFYLDFPLLKMAVLPLVLLMWPLLATLLYVPLLRVQLPHWEGRTQLCYRVAAWFYVPLAGAAAWWFWQLTARL